MFDTIIRVLEIAYIPLLILVCFRIIWDTNHTVKALAYLLLTIFMPVVGMVFYFMFGVNYRKRKLYSRKLIRDVELAKKVSAITEKGNEDTVRHADKSLGDYKELAHLLMKDSQSPLTEKNEVRVLQNGELKFPDVFEALEAAQHHIHIEYYIYEPGKTGDKLTDILIEKAKQGVQVRFIYDAIGSSKLKKELKHMKAVGVEAFPFSKLTLTAFANRINYRNHRKIIILDGYTAFVGGINVSDRYVNSGEDSKKQLFWRDTHLRIDGPAVHYLQKLFLNDWNFCAKQQLTANSDFFPVNRKSTGNKYVQIAASGPDSDKPTILYALLQAINIAKEELLITTPYFIPGESVMDAISIAALGGVKVKMLVPGKSDSALVNAAAYSYYSDLLAAGVEVYLYHKGFVHAKTLVSDGQVAIVGTANMDYRSFDLNFEVNAVVYDKELAQEMRDTFYEDLQFANRIDPVEWEKRPFAKKLLERTVRLFSPLL